MKTNSIAAIVVTFNRLALLKTCINAIMSQTTSVDLIIIVNNGSTDGTLEWLESVRHNNFHVINQDNSGSAGGMYTGISTAYKMGFEWFWCMDDDGLPDDLALEQLFNFAHRKPCMMNSLVVNIQDSTKLAFPIFGVSNTGDFVDSVIPDITHLFNGTFIHREVVSTVGLPMKALFIWGDESEYFYRVKHKFPCFTVVNSKHYHPKPTFNWKDNWHESNFFKLWYKIRNQFFVYKSQHKRYIFAIIKYIFFIFSILTIVILFQKNKLNKIRLVISGIKGIKRMTF